MPFSPLPTILEIQTRLERIFPEGTERRSDIVSARAARVIFTMLYIGAVEGSGTALAPVQVYRMTTEQAQRTSSEARAEYLAASRQKRYQPEGERWFADNTRESIRDDTIREGFLPVNAIIADHSIPTTSSKGRYLLQSDFAGLLDPNRNDADLDQAISAWRDRNLSRSALTRTTLLRRGVVAREHSVLVKLPNGMTRQMSPGMSSILTKALIEEFSPRFLLNPAVLWISESSKRVVAADQELALQIGIRIDAAKILPDVILVDLGPRDPLIVFAEIVATDGPMSETRKQTLVNLATEGGYDPECLVFVTVFEDRGASTFKKRIEQVALDTFVWTMAEPDTLIWLKGQIGPSKSEPIANLLGKV